MDASDVVYIMSLVEGKTVDLKSRIIALEAKVEALESSVKPENIIAKCQEHQQAMEECKVPHVEPAGEQS